MQRRHLCFPHVVSAYAELNVTVCKVYKMATGSSSDTSRNWWLLALLLGCSLAVAVSTGSHFQLRRSLIAAKLYECG